MQKLENLVELEAKQNLNKREQRAEIIRECFDIEIFVDTFFLHVKVKVDEFGRERYVESPYYHLEIWDALGGGSDINIIVARGHGKTTCLRLYFIWSLIYNPEDTILYIASSGLGEEVIGRIMFELENNRQLIEVYGNLVPTNSEDVKDKRLKKWRSKKLELLNGGDIMTVSKGQPVRGRRRRLVVIDDPQENKDVRNKGVVDRFNDWIFTSLYNTMLPGGRMVVVGTIIGNMCLVKHLRDNLQRHTIEYKAIENGKPIRPEMRSLEELEKRKKKLGTAQFNQEFLNIPLLAGARVIDNSWIRYYEERPDFDYKVLAIDPAISQKESADYIGIVGVGEVKIDKGEVNRFILHSGQYKMSMKELARHIMGLHEAEEYNVIYVENVAFQEMLRQELSSLGLPIKAVRPHKDKMTRLQSVSGLFEFGQVFFRKRGDEELIYQLTNFPDVEHDDILDACVYAMSDRGTGFTLINL